MSRNQLLGKTSDYLFRTWYYSTCSQLNLFSRSKYCQVLAYTTAADSANDIDSKPKISKAMRAYLQRSQEHDQFFKQQKTEFDIGVRHLANMMGEDPETFTQKDIDRAIEYLFPSGLFDPKARPIMKPPEDIFPKRKEAEFDYTGRPHHHLFYTGKPNFFSLLHDVVNLMNQLNDYEDKMTAKNIQPEHQLAFDLSGSEWLPKLQLEQILVESLSDADYDSFVHLMDRILNHPFSNTKKDFILQYRKTLVKQIKYGEINVPEIDSDGSKFITIKECLRKRARGEVTVRYPGNGKISINGKDINYFEGSQEREQLLFPLIFNDMLFKVDVEATVAGGGPTSQAGAIRWGIAMGLRSFVEEDQVERMRIAGLLQRDYRTPERKKPGQEGARRKFTWKKR